VKSHSYTQTHTHTLAHSRARARPQVASLENVLCIETLAWINVFMPGSSKKVYDKEEEGCDINAHQGGNLFAFASKKCPYLWYVRVRARASMCGRSVDRRTQGHCKHSMMMMMSFICSCRNKVGAWRMP
jgi:hypothetical protein